MSRKKRPKKREFYYSFKHNPEKGIDDMAYEIIGITAHTETLEELVVYKPLYECKYLKEHNLDFWTRPLDMFLEEVDKDGYKGSRFIRIKDIDVVEEIRKLSFMF